MEARVEAADTLGQGWVGRQQPRLGPGAEGHMADLLGLRDQQPATGLHGDAPQGPGYTVRIAGVLHGAGVGQILALAGQGRLDQARRQQADGPDQSQGPAEEDQK